MSHRGAESRLWALVCLVCTAPVAVGAMPGIAGAQTLAGFVVDQSSGNSIALARVTLMDLDSVPVAEVLTNLSGYFAIEAPEQDAYWVSAEAAFFNSYAAGPLFLTEGDTSAVAFTLVPRPVALEGLVVEARNRARRMIRGGYFDRRETGYGWHADRAEIERRARFRISEALRGIPAVRLVNAGVGDREPLFRERRASSGEECYPRVYVDGLLFSPGGPMPTELDKALDPDRVEAIEAFEPPWIPVAFGGSGLAPCGAIAVWTR